MSKNQTTNKNNRLYPSSISQALAGFILSKLLPATMVSVMVSAIGGCSMQTDNQTDDNAKNKTPTIAQNADTNSFMPISIESDSTTDVYAGRNNGAWGGVYMSEEEVNDSLNHYSLNHGVTPQTDNSTDTQANNLERHVVNIDAVPAYDQDPSIEIWNKKFGTKNAYTSTDGKKLYHDSCAACHMHTGKGAYGAGYYPPLANNSKMESKHYIISILVNGLRGMPSFGDMMDDEQIAAVTQYVMQDLNNYQDKVSAEDVAKLRPNQAPSYDPYDE